MTPQESHDIDGMRRLNELTSHRDGIQRMLFRHLLCVGLLVGGTAMLLLVTLCQAVAP